jgi:hypothetical protein
MTLRAPALRASPGVVTLAMLAAVALPTPLAALQDPAPPDAGARLLVGTLEAHRHPVGVAGGGLAGAGGAWLVAQGREADFFLLGEEHGVAEIPGLTGALFRALTREAGYRHLAIETGDGMAAALDSLARLPDPEAALVGWFEAHWPGAPFFTLAEEAELLVEAVAASPASQVLWGLDYDIMADRHALPRLETLARTGAQREAVAHARSVADSLLRLAMDEGNPAHVLMFGGPVEVLEELRRGWDPVPASEADRILRILEATRGVNELWLTGQGLASNHERARWNKAQFAHYWTGAGGGLDPAGEAGEAPRVLFKFGANHMLRGRNFTDVHDLGALASELADARGGRSFHLLVVAGEGSESAALDPTTMTYRPQPAGTQGAAWAAPLFEAARDAEVSPGAPWTLLELAPLRALAAAGRLGTLPEQLQKVIWGFDAVVVLHGSRAATMLPVDRPW